jgi:hypothetical protein
MPNSPSIFPQTLSLSKKLGKARRQSLTVLFLIGFFINFYFSDLVETAGVKDDSTRILASLAMGLADFAEGLILIFLLSYSLIEVQPLKGPPFHDKPLNPLDLKTFMAEYLRMMAHIILWSIAFILPGFYKYATLIFVPPITLFSAAYQKNQVDAIQLSKELAGKNLALILPVVFGLVLLQIGFELLPLATPLLHTLPARLIFALISFLLSIAAYAFVMVLFEQEMRKKAWN